MGYHDVTVPRSQGFEELGAWNRYWLAALSWKTNRLEKDGGGSKYTISSIEACLTPDGGYRHEPDRRTEVPHAAWATRDCGEAQINSGEGER